MESNKNCPKCHGAGMIKEKNGTVHICFDCLNKGVFEQHGNPKETNIKV